MRKLITAGHSYTVQHSGLNQSFMVAMEKHDSQPINIHGTHTTWILESDFLKLRDSLSRMFEAEDMFTINRVKKEISDVINELENAEKIKALLGEE